jgi:alkylation response protein AidB-like acyl-CoA dehydrogenase
MRGTTTVLLGLVGLMLSGCVFFSKEPILKRSDTFPGVGKWSCQGLTEGNGTTEIKRDGNNYRVNGELVWFKAIDKGFYILQVFQQPTEDIPYKHYAYAWVELEKNRLSFYIASMDGLVAAPNKALRAGVQLEPLSEDIPVYMVKGKPEQAIRFLSSFKKSELIPFATCTKR